jgi:hypothetical protein
MLSEEQIFNMSEDELEEKIKMLNQAHITIKKRENPNTFSQFDYGGVKQDILSDHKLTITIKKLELDDLINKINSINFYNLVEPMLGSIIQRHVGKIINGYQIEDMEIQTSIPLCVQFLVGDDCPSDNEIVPHLKEVEEITYGELGEKILNSILTIKYILNKGQCGSSEYLYLNQNTLKEIKTKHDFYNLNQEIQSIQSKTNKRIKL